MKRIKLRVWVIDKRTIYVTFFTLILVIIVFTRIVFSNDLIPESDNYLKFRTIVIDPGHGGIDGGANIGSVLEKDINLSISKEVNSILKANSAKTILTRDTDMSLDKLFNMGSSRYKRDLNARVNIINQASADLFVSIHANCFLSDTSQNGAMFFYRISESPSHKLAECIMNRVNTVDFGNFKRNVHSPQIGDYYILRNANIPGIIIETGFISNPQDREILLNNNYKHKIAQAICLGINDYFKTQQR